MKIKPIQYIEKKAYFMDMELFVDERVFIPRPETELLVEIVSNLCREKSLENPFILDIGTGSGVIPIGVARLLKTSCIVGIDISQDALDVARANIKDFKLEENIFLARMDMLTAFRAKKSGIFHAIVSNPPYVSRKDYEGLDAHVKAEPYLSLYGGPDGMDKLRFIIKHVKPFLISGGFIALEVGYDQSEKVKKEFLINGFDKVASFRDFNNYERVIVGWKNG